MKEGGIFSFILFLLLVQAVIVLERTGIESRKEMDETLGLLENAEQINFTRQEIEIAFDYAVSRTIQEEARMGFDGARIKGRIMANLGRIFRQIEMKSDDKTKFYIFQKPFFTKNEISFEKLSENSGILIIDSGRGVSLIQFYSTGNLEKNELIGAEIISENALQKFVVPIGYSRTEVAVGILQ